MDRENSDRIITTQTIREFLEQSQTTYFLRSSLSGRVGHCADVIRQACLKSKTRKEIKVILPSVVNPDLFLRAGHVRLNRQEVLTRLVDWLEELVKLVDELAPAHSFELRTTMEPHRWHGVFTETEGIAGLAWHASANMSYSSLDLGPGLGSCKWMLNFMSADFEWLWGQSTPYVAGMAARQLEHASSSVAAAVHPLLAGFKSRLPRVMDVLRVIKNNYPDADGCGITKSGMHRHFGIDKANGNDLLLEMQKAGLVEMIGPDPEESAEVAGRRRHGRVLSVFGRHSLKEWDETHPPHRPNR